MFFRVWPGFIPTAMGWEYMVSYWKAGLPVDWLASVLIPGQQKHQVSNEKKGPGLFYGMYRGWIFLPCYMGIMSYTESYTMKIRIRIPIKQPAFNGKYLRVFFCMAQVQVGFIFLDPPESLQETNHSCLIHGPFSSRLCCFTGNTIEFDISFL